jgi:hypothetical protein
VKPGYFPAYFYTTTTFKNVIIFQYTSTFAPFLSAILLSRLRINLSVSLAPFYCYFLSHWKSNSSYNLLYVIKSVDEEIAENKCRCCIWTSSSLFFLLSHSSSEEFQLLTSIWCTVESNLIHELWVWAYITYRVTTFFFKVISSYKFKKSNHILFLSRSETMSWFHEIFNFKNLYGLYHVYSI